MNMDMGWRVVDGRVSDEDQSKLASQSEQIDKLRILLQRYLNCLLSCLPPKVKLIIPIFVFMPNAS